jgi:hypothetical protein
MNKKITLALMLAAHLFSANETITYESVTDEKKLTTKWEVELKGHEIDVTYANPDQDSLIKMSDNYQFELFKQTEKTSNTWFEVKRSGKSISAVRQENKNAPLKKQYNSKYPWLQEFGFGLKPFVASKESEFKFCILGPQDLALHNMVAKKIKFENITINGKKYNALKVKVTLQGFKSAFWKGYSWWDTDNHLMLRYQANSGPHTAVTTTNYISGSAK